MKSHASLVGEYLRARRDITQPEDVGLPREPNRRVSGLRREEVAALAGISAEYYLRLEQGRDHQPSEQVIVCLGRALALDDHALTHLRRLARPAVRRPRDPVPAAEDPAVQRLLARRADVPAFVVDDRMDVVASTPLASALGPSMRAGANRLVRMFTVVDRVTYPDWSGRAAEMVAVFRMRADLDDPRTQDLIGQLSIRDPEFAAMWARHDVHVYTSGTCFEHVQPFGVLEFEWEGLVIPGREGLTLNTLYAPTGSRGAAVLAYLMESAPSVSPAQQ
ncbi:helix-turn-helix transcriptional regulator [Curtobacterium sp. PhB115]|uniref:helix-turn-helix transcriptional regulator n=1 Tax=Curtobacterium sp. PhB115 TaxID=2485173 RepID=UPI000FADBD5E|nr:helix-turn-helix transcriptional regulator [Curtobacterium sp. PhB115]ROP65445.1 helix-turn-helix protein [Curtobacterium sp. PhB115]